MSSVKISQLNLITQLNANTSNTLFVAVDIPSGVTGKFTGHTLAQGLYSNEVLNVGTNPVIYPGVVAQFSGNSNAAITYAQINFQNFTANGSTDYVASTSDSNNANSFIDMGISGKDYSDPVYYSAFKSYDGYLYVAGPTTTSYSGNLILGTASSNAGIIFIAGGTMANNVVAKMTANGLSLNTQSYITFADGTKQFTSGATYVYSNLIFAQSNSSFAQANAAFLKANNAIANTGSINANSVIANTATLGNLTISNNAIYSSATSQDMIIGQSIATANLVINRTTNITKDLGITGNIIVQGTYIDFNNSTFNPNTAFVQITGSNNNTTVAPSNTNYMLQVTGKANTVTRVVLDSFGAATYPVLVGRMGRGSADIPGAVANNDVMMRIVGNGYTGTQFPASSPSKIDFIASENFSDTNRGTRIEFYNTPTGSNTIQRVASFNADSVTFSGRVEPQKGFVYTPTIYPGNQTAITIDVANTAVTKANTTAGLVVTLSNLLSGKETILWVVNTAGTNQTFTHGLSALNSTINSTTYTIPGTSTILVRYMCMDNTLANTFVAITHA